MMRRNVWMTTAVLVGLASLTTVIDGCSDDGVGTIPSNLFVIERDAAGGDPAVVTGTTPAATNPTPGTDAGMDARRAEDAAQPPPPPPKDSGSPMDSGSTGM